MEHYKKASSHTVGSDEKKEAFVIHVKSGSKIRNILAQAFRLLQVFTWEFKIVYVNRLYSFFDYLVN